MGRCLSATTTFGLTLRLVTVLVSVVACSPRGAARPGTSATQPRGEATSTVVTAPAERCAALARLARDAWPDSSTVITSASLRAAGDAIQAPAGAARGPSAPALPEHCEVTGRLRDRTGIDGQHYAIQFHMRLPTSWNGRFLFQGGGGSDGAVGDAIGAIGPGAPSALARGFAVLSQDSGHDNRTNNDPARQGSIAFAYDPQARRDLAYASLDVTARTGKAIVRAFYGRAPDRSYFYGCSEGGREGMVFAQRFPELFDGIVAAAPGFALPKAAIAEAWDTQAFASLANRSDLMDSAGTPIIARTFSDADLALVADAVLAACDADDGVADGIVGDYRACTTERVVPALAARTCRDAKSAACLSADQVPRCSVCSPARATPEARRSTATGRGTPGSVVGRRAVPPGLADLEDRRISPEHGPLVERRARRGVAVGGVHHTTDSLPNDPRALLGYYSASTWSVTRRRSSHEAARSPSRVGIWSARSRRPHHFPRQGGKLIVPHGMSDPVFSATTRCGGGTR